MKVICYINRSTMLVFYYPLHKGILGCWMCLLDVGLRSSGTPGQTFLYSSFVTRRFGIEWFLWSSSFGPTVHFIFCKLEKILQGSGRKEYLYLWRYPQSEIRTIWTLEKHLRLNWGHRKYHMTKLIWNAVPFTFNRCNTEMSEVVVPETQFLWNK